MVEFNLNNLSERAKASMMDQLSKVAEETAADIMGSGTPVNAVAASKTLTLSGLPTDNDTLTVGSTVYTFASAIGSGVAATATLLISGSAADGDTIGIGNKTYRLRSAIGEGTAASKALDLTNVPLNNETVVLDDTTYTFKGALTESKASSTLTATANPADGARMTIGTTVYTFRDTIADAYDIKIGGSQATTLANIVAAITHGDTEGTTYGTGTVAHPDVTATTNGVNTVTVTAKVPGVAANSIATTEISPNLSFNHATLESGVDPVANEVFIGSVSVSLDNLVAAVMGTAGEGSTYSTGTVHPTTVSLAKTDADTVTATATEAGVAGNEIAIDETLTNGAWAGDATTLSGGVDPSVANDVLLGSGNAETTDNLVAAINGAEGEGTTYGTGTVAHTQVTAEGTTDTQVVVTAKAVGEAGEAIVLTNEVDTNTVISWDHPTLSGGEDAQAANMILIGVSAEATIDNIVAAATAAAGAGTTYGTGTVAHPTVLLTKTNASTITATARTKGVAGNNIAIAENAANTAWAGGATKLSGGVNGTVGVANQIMADSSYLYIAIAANTISDANWRRISVGSAY